MRIHNVKFGIRRGGAQLPETNFLLQVETAKVEASNASQAATLKEEEAKLKEKEKEVQAVQAALDKQMRDVEKKGRELDALNRRYQKVMAAVPVGEDAGMHITDDMLL